MYQNHKINAIRTLSLTNLATSTTGFSILGNAKPDINFGKLEREYEKTKKYMRNISKMDRGVKGRL